jgi:DNA-binding Lrp family transcriptional regulator
MMTKGYLLINTSSGRGDKSYVTRAGNTARLIREIPGVGACYVVAGAYQVIAEIESVDQIGDIVLNRVQAIPGIDRCTVCVAVAEALEMGEQGPVIASANS